MRGKWVIATGAVLALVVVGGVGGLTMRAFAGTTRVTITDTKVVTRLCVYVDRKDKGQSYGDLSVLPKYHHKVCIVGKPGPAGDSSVITWNKTVATAASPGAKRRAGGLLPPGAVDLATVGPFTIRGFCTQPDNVRAVTDVISGKDGSSFAWDDSSYPGTFNSGNDQPASTAANGSSQSPDFQNEQTIGDFAASTGDSTTSFTGSANNGVYLNGPNGPACSFSGYVVVETAPAG